MPGKLKRAVRKVVTRRSDISFLRNERTRRLLAFLKALGVCDTGLRYAMRHHKGRTLEQAWHGEKDGKRLLDVLKSVPGLRPAVPCKMCGPSCWYNMDGMSADEIREAYKNTVPWAVSKCYWRVVEEMAASKREW